MMNNKIPKRQYRTFHFNRTNHQPVLLQSFDDKFISNVPTVKLIKETMINFTQLHAPETPPRASTSPLQHSKIIYVRKKNTQMPRASSLQLKKSQATPRQAPSLRINTDIHLPFQCNFLGSSMRLQQRSTWSNLQHKNSYKSVRIKEKRKVVARSETKTAIHRFEEISPWQYDEAFI